MSAGSHQRNAFYALQSCHQILYGDSGEFFSPDYLCSNPALWCNWTIQVQPGKHVQLYLEDLTPEHVCHLKTDQIHLDEAPVSGGGRRILEHCWRRSMYTSASSTVHVVQLIRQNPNPPHRGFYGAYQAFGIPKTPDQFEMMSEKDQVPSKETEDKDAVNQIPIHENISNDLDENAEDVHTEHVEANHSIIPQVNKSFTVNAGSFGESRKIRGQEANNQDVPFNGELAEEEEEEDDEELVNWITMEQYTPVWFDGPHGPHNPAPTHTAHTISTSADTTLTRSTKKRVRKRKPGLGQSFPTKATMKKNEVAHLNQVASSSSEDPTEDMMAEQTVSIDILKSDDDTTLQEHVGLDENREIKEKSPPVQTFRLATETPHLTVDCSRTSAPTLLYAVCFLLCFLIALLLVVLAVMYRRYHHGTFLPRCRPSSSSNFTGNDINNNPTSGRGDDRRASRSHPPPPPPPLRMAGGARDLPLLRFSSLTPPGGFEGKLQKENDSR
ncbi:uncharacterized protein Hap1MRO34_020497 [Clarias gariepinus]